VTRAGISDAAMRVLDRDADARPLGGGLGKGKRGARVLTGLDSTKGVQIFAEFVRLADQEIVEPEAQARTCR
jgi:hypothetical protein